MCADLEIDDEPVQVRIDLLERKHRHEPAATGGCSSNATATKGAVN